MHLKVLDLELRNLIMGRYHSTGIEIILKMDNNTQ